jgi:hypothetical protein
VKVLATHPVRSPQNCCLAASIVRLSTSLDDSSIDVVADLVVDGADDMMTTAAGESCFLSIRGNEDRAHKPKDRKIPCTYSCQHTAAVR